MTDKMSDSTSHEISVQRENEVRLSLLFEIGQILATAETTANAAPQILETVCRNLDFQLGEFWIADGEVLRLQSEWHLSAPDIEKFVRASRNFEFQKGAGLPGRVWEAFAPVWIEDFAAEGLPRIEAAIVANLKSAVGFPILLDDALPGVFTFFSRDKFAADATLLQIFAAVGNHAGQFIKRERSEKHLRESEESYRIVAETASDVIIKINTQSRILFVNRAVERIFGFTVDEMLGQELTMIMPADMRDKHRAGFARYLNKGVRHLDWSGIEVPAQRKNGEVFPLEVSFGEYDQNGERFFIGIARDITERHHALRQSAEQTRLALLNAEVNRALIQNDSLSNILRRCTDAVVEHLEAAFARIWTLDAAENILELKASSGLYTHLDGKHSRIPVGEFKIGTIAAERRPHLTNAVIGDERVGDQEWAKREKITAFAAYPLIVEDHLVGVIAMFARQPLTEKIIEVLAVVANAVALGIERKQTEIERERLLIVAQQNREIAEQANRAKDEFIAVVSHELRSPLNAILGWTRVLQQQQPDAKTVAYALDVVVRNARSQSKLIDDLLDIARINKGKLRLDLRLTEFAPIINAAVETIKPAAEIKNITITRTLDRAADFITGDDERLRQVVENLLSNAVKFTPENGAIDLRLELGADGEMIKFTVSDNGQGINAAFLPEIFERFSQADASNNRRHGGLGIGLSLARDLVELHDGTIAAASAGEDQGSTFTILLPRRKIPTFDEKTARNANDMDVQGKLKGFWILAVDDEPDARDLISFMLQMNGAKVTSAQSAVEALEILGNSTDKLPDVLLSDISMPNESGYALLEKIRALPPESGGHLPAIALTAFNRPEDRQSAFDAGFQKHLGKPVEMEDLIFAIIETAAK